MLVAPIKSLAFNLRHQVFVNTLRFTGFDNKMDTAIESSVRKVRLYYLWLGYREAKNFQTKPIKEFEFLETMFLFPCLLVLLSFISAFSSVNTFLRSFEFDDAPHRRQQTDLIKDSPAIFGMSRLYRCGVTSLIHTFHWPNFFTQFPRLFKSRAHETNTVIVPGF